VFDSCLQARIDDRCAHLASMLMGDVAMAAPFLLRITEDGRVDGITGAHRRFHDINGLASIIGFEATGRSAPARPGLPALELVRLTESLESARGTAQIKTQAIKLNWELVS
jgi:hypothetical protein